MRIKVCGLTRVEEAEYLNRNRVDFAGFVLFYPKSRRNIGLKRAKEIMEALDPLINRVAVVVSPGLPEVRQIEEAGFDYIQIHGDITEDVLANIHIPVLKAFNIRDMDQYECYRQRPQVAGYVFDAQEPGSGRTFDWRLVEKLPGDGKLFFLAGGLHVKNVRQAIERIGPDAVDVSSGVEYEDGQGKDGNKIDEFVGAVREGGRE